MGPGPARRTSSAARGHEILGETRHPLRRSRQHLSASRSRNCAERGLHRKEIRSLLVTLRAFAGRRPKDVGRGQLLHLARPDWKRHTGREVRYALMRVHYRAPLNFTWEGMEEARQSLARIDDWLERLRDRGTSNGATSSSKSSEPNQQFEEALDDDLNISAALGFLFESIRETNRALDAGELDSAGAQSWLDWWNRVNTVLALSSDESTLPAEIAALATRAQQAAKDWRKSDELLTTNTRGWERGHEDGRYDARTGRVAMHVAPADVSTRAH